MSAAAVVLLFFFHRKWKEKKRASESFRFLFTFFRWNSIGKWKVKETTKNWWRCRKDNAKKHYWKNNNNNEKHQIIEHEIQTNTNKRSAFEMLFQTRKTKTENEKKEQQTKGLFCVYFYRGWEMRNALKWIKMK